MCKDIARMRSLGAHKWALPQQQQQQNTNQVIRIRSRASNHQQQQKQHDSNKTNAQLNAQR